MLQPEEVAPDPRAAGVYYEMRNKATEGFGTEKRIRNNNMMRERVTRNCEVAEIEKCKELLGVDLKGQSSRVESRKIQAKADEYSKASSYEKDLALKKEPLGLSFKGYFMLFYVILKDFKRLSKGFEDGIEASPRLLRHRRARRHLCGWPGLHRLGAPHREGGQLAGRQRLGRDRGRSALGRGLVEILKLPAEEITKLNEKDQRDVEARPSFRGKLSASNR